MKMPTVELVVTYEKYAFVTIIRTKLVEKKDGLKC